MKLTTGILAVAMMTAAAWGQNPDAIDNARSVAKSLQQIKTNQTNAALEGAGEPASPQAAKPVAGSPAKPATGPQSNPAPATTAGKPHDAFLPKQTAAGAAKLGAPQRSAKPEVATSKIAVNEKPAGASKSGEAAKAPKPEEKKWAMTGKRDPFFSPVLQQTSGSGCSTGKKCLEIGQINVRGVVKSESGFIAVVTNSLNKAYFLHENDPVFNGYVVRITGDSVVFQETVQDKLGKPLTHEVVKRIFTPAV
jgi:Tfp pilus assembly protein PilP